MTDQQWTILPILQLFPMCCKFNSTKRTANNLGVIWLDRETGKINPDSHTLCSFDKVLFPSLLWPGPVGHEAQATALSCEEDGVIKYLAFLPQRNTVTSVSSRSTGSTQYTRKEYPNRSSIGFLRLKKVHCQIPFDFSSEPCQVIYLRSDKVIIQFCDFSRQWWSCQK